MGMFREAAEIIHKMWAEDYPTFEGRHYTIDAPINEPKGVRKPHPSLWIGGGGERVTLKIVAQYSDACNFGNGNPEIVRRKLDVLKRHRDALGRDHDEIFKSTEINCVLLDGETDREQATAGTRELLDVSYEEFSKSYWVGTSEEIAEQLRPVIDAGIDYVIHYVLRVAYDHRPMQQFAREVIPQCA
jgi:alkanesulfonate monooxygenase SsuD/methylene tetrahydromethanopterin reductase-like flavin-dependent oxidoreductase (luciferase family)